MKILFSDEKMFDIDGVYNSQNERIWAANRMEADAKVPTKSNGLACGLFPRGFSFDHFRGRYT